MMKHLLVCIAMICTALTASANSRILKNDSGLLKKIDKLEARVNSHQRELLLLKKKNAELSRMIKRKPSASQKAVIIRRGSKQVVFD